MSSQRKKARASGQAKTRAETVESVIKATESQSTLTDTIPVSAPKWKLKKPSAAAILLLGILILGLAIRLLPVVWAMSGGHVIFSEFDPYYHMRRITYSVEHFPFTNAFDSYVAYPNGYYVGWPPLFDLLGAAASLMIGLGNPDRGTIELVSASLPVVIGLMAMIAVYIFVKDVINEHVALGAAFVMAFLPAAVLRSTFGFVDHHVLEVFLSVAMYVLFLRSAVKGSAQALTLKMITAGKTPVLYAILAGLAMAAMVLAWDGSPIFIALILVFAFCQYALDARQGRRSEYLTIAGTIAAIVALVVVAPIAATTPFGRQFAISAIYLSWFHIFMLAAVLAFFPFMEGARRAVSAVKAPWYALPAAVLAVGGIGLLLVKTLLPQVFVNLEAGLTYLQGGSLVLSSIAEVAPLLTYNGNFSLVVVWVYFSTAIFLSVAGLALYLWSLRNARLESGTILFLVWTGFIVSLGLLQSRFIYLLGACVSVYAGYAIYRALNAAGLEQLLKSGKDDGPKAPKHNGSRRSMLPVAVTAAVILLLLAYPAYSSVQRFTQPEPYLLDWDEAGAWVRDNTPATSHLYTPDEDKLPEYSVMTIWDYGNYVLYRAERPAVANNFQTGIYDSMQFFIAQNESSADRLMEKHNSRYVMVDRRMSSSTIGIYYGVFENMPILAGEEVASYFMSYRTPIPYSTVPYIEGNDKYYGTMFSRLFNDRGCGGMNTLGNVTDGLEHYRLIFITNGTDPVAVFEKVKGATISGTAEPGAKVELTLELDTPYEHRDYFSHTFADQSGSYSFTVPYPTGAAGAVKTASNYVITSDGSSAVVQVTTEAVTQGNTVTAGGL